MLTSPINTLRDHLRAEGFAAAGASLIAARMDVSGADWRGFAASWNDLEPDAHMADGGRYRRRRFGVASLAGGVITPQPRQPHFQTKDANPLNGGIDRWFAPMAPARMTAGPMAAAISLCRDVFELDAGAGAPEPAWRIEAHQFRIEAREGQAGLPTPEGVHRDGVDWAFVMLVGRENTAGGVTTIFDPERRPLGAFRLAEPMEAVF
ncbi:MAG: 2OG-Fe dioxygenase family protein, partial [Caulobacteraceae bacterium]|nr:2OG-Fe dioxygenase family protein [Caulobacteraceae bacterium]